MKISFPKCGSAELLTRKQGATPIICFVAIALLAVVCGSYFLGNRMWLLTITLLGIAGVLLSLGVAAAIFLNKSEVNETPSALIEENVPRLTPQWDYRPRKPIRARGVLNSSSTETSDGLSSDLFVTNDTVWCNDNSLEGAAFINLPPDGEELRMKVLSEPTDAVCAAPTADDAAVSR
jgi:hypothetical protein